MTVGEIEHVVVVGAFVEDVEAWCVALMVTRRHRHEENGDRDDTRPGKPATNAGTAFAFALR